MYFKADSAERILKGSGECRDKKCRFSVTSVSAPVHSVYAAIKASAGFKPRVSYFTPNAKGTSLFSSIVVNLCMKMINSLNASGVRLGRTSFAIRRGMRREISPYSSATSDRSFSQRGSLIAPKAKIYSLLSRMSSNCLLPELLSGLTDSIDYLLFGQAFVRGMHFRHQLFNFLQMRLSFFGISFIHKNHLLCKDTIFSFYCQERLGRLGVYGDASGDGSITAYDAGLALAQGKTTLEAAQIAYVAVGL